MTHSHAEVPSLQCPQCGASFSAEIWLIVDAAERPDLFERVIDGAVHTVVCPNGYVSELDAPPRGTPERPRRFESGTVLLSPTRWPPGLA